MSMAVRKQPRRLKDIASTLADGDKVRELCPFCAGGSTKESSFSIERRGSSAFYKCYRASCDAKGRINYGGISESIIGTTINNNIASKVTRFLGDSHKLTVNYLQFFKDKFNIQPVLMSEYGVKIIDDGRVLFPILGPDGKVRGENIRYYEELTPPKQNIYKPKATIYLSSDSLSMSWHRLSTFGKGVDGKPDLTVPYFFKDCLIIVEDQVSAIKASRLVDAVALLGTNLSMRKVLEIVKESNKCDIYKRIIILLDGDAYDQALKTYIRTRALMKGICVKKLEKDVKDMTYSELFKLLDEVRKDYEQ